MAVTANSTPITIEAASGADIARKRFVTRGASGFAYPAAAGDECDAVTVDDYDDSGFTAGTSSNAITAHPIQTGARVPVEAGAAIAAGARVMANTAGKAITATTGQISLGVAEVAATADGSIITVFLTKKGEPEA